MRKLFIVDYFPKHSILDIWQGFEYTSAIYVQKYCLFHMFQNSEDKTEISHQAKSIFDQVIFCSLVDLSGTR